LRSKDESHPSDFGWGSLVKGKLTIKSLQGSHSEVLKDPNLASSAQQLVSALDTLEG